MNDLIKTVLLANSSQLAFNWIYNQKFLENYSKDNNMLMQPINHKHYEENKPSYYAYPNAKVGDVTLQGEVIKWLYNDWKNHEIYNQNHYKKLLLNHLMPGGLYQGYVESYGHKLVLNEINKKFKFKDIIADDDQLIGFTPYIVAKALNKDMSEALKLTYLLTNNTQYENYYKALDFILKNGKEKLNEAIKLMPVEHQDKIKLAISTNDKDDFVKDSHDLSCSIDVAMPLIFHLYNKHNSLLDALKENVVVGGASSDRALLLGLLFYPNQLPKEWDQFLIF